METAKVEKKGLKEAETELEKKSSDVNEADIIDLGKEEEDQQEKAKGNSALEAKPDVTEGSPSLEDENEEVLPDANSQLPTTTEQSIRSELDSEDVINLKDSTQHLPAVTVVEPQTIAEEKEGRKFTKQGNDDKEGNGDEGNENKERKVSTGSVHSNLGVEDVVVLGNGKKEEENLDKDAGVEITHTGDDVDVVMHPGPQGNPADHRRSLQMSPLTTSHGQLEPPDAPWTPPDRTEAKKYGQTLKWQRGAASYRDTSVKDMGAMGVGIYLYFYVLSILSLLFLSFTILSIPSMYFCSIGNGLTNSTEASTSAWSFARISIANLGNCQTDEDGVTITCSYKIYDGGLFGDISFDDTTYIISGFEWGIALIWMFAMGWLSKRINAIQKEMDAERVTPADYTVYVRGVPWDTTTVDLLDHFNERYDLSKEQNSYPVMGLSVKGVAVFWAPILAIVALALSAYSYQDYFLGSSYGTLITAACCIGTLIVVGLLTAGIITYLKIGKPRPLKTPEAQYDDDLILVKEEIERKKRVEEKKKKMKKALTQQPAAVAPRDEEQVVIEIQKDVDRIAVASAPTSDSQDKDKKEILNPMVDPAPVTSESSRPSTTINTPKAEEQAQNVAEEDNKNDVQPMEKQEEVKEQATPPVDGSENADAQELKDADKGVPLDSKPPTAKDPKEMQPDLDEETASKKAENPTAEEGQSTTHTPPDEGQTSSAEQKQSPRPSDQKEGQTDEETKEELHEIDGSPNETSSIPEDETTTTLVEEIHLKPDSSAPEMVVLPLEKTSNDNQLPNDEEVPEELTLKDPSPRAAKVPPMIVPPPRCGPVLDESNTGEPRYRGTWIADIRLNHPNGKIIRDVKAKEGLLTKTYRTQRALKMYEFKKKEAKVQKMKEKLEKLKKKVEKLEKKTDNYDTTKLSLTDAAFITFNNEESTNRCVHDYRYSSFWFWRKFQPPELRFQKEGHVDKNTNKPKQYCLEVSAAPEPSNVLWQNLEVGWKEKVLRRSFTALLTLLLLVGSFIVIYYAQVEKEKAANSVPDLTICVTQLPATFYGTYNFPSNATLQRTKSMDITCDTNAYYMGYGANHTDLPDLAIPGSNDTYPRANTTALCDDGCYSYSSSQSCDYLSCVIPEWEEPNHGSYECSSYQESTMVACFCFQTLVDLITSEGFKTALDTIYNEQWDVCGTFAQAYLTAFTLQIMSAVVVVFVNTLLKSILISLAKFERHSSVSGQAAAVTVKIAFAQFLNTAIITLIVNSKITQLSSNQFISTIGLFNGSYDDFSRDWYLSVGAALTLTMLINVAIPHISPLAKALVVTPLKRLLKQKGAVSQEDLNKFYEAPKFEIETRYAYVLNCIFVTMVYGGGMPILYLFAFFNMALSFAIDKLFVVKLNIQPPNYDCSLATLFMKAMPLVLIIHLGMTCYMFGNTIIWGNDIVGEAKDYVATANPFWNHIAPKVLKYHVFPLFLTLCIYFTCYLSYKVVGRLLIAFLRNTVAKVFDNCGKQIPELVGLTPTLTGEMVTTMPDEVYEHVHKYGQLDKDYLKQGWEMVSLEPPIMRKNWQEISFLGVHHSSGDPQKTWEYLAEQGLHSYQIDLNKDYRNAMAFIYGFMEKKGLRRGSLVTVPNILDCEQGEKGKEGSANEHTPLLSGDADPGENTEDKNALEPDQVTPGQEISDDADKEDDCGEKATQKIEPRTETGSVPQSSEEKGKVVNRENGDSPQTAKDPEAASNDNTQDIPIGKENIETSDATNSARKNSQQSESVKEEKDTVKQATNIQTDSTETNNQNEEKESEINADEGSNKPSNEQTVPFI